MLQKCSILKVARVFFNEPTKSHYLIEISKKSGIAHTSVKQYLNELKKQSIITENFETKGKRKFPIYKADLDSSEYRSYKMISNQLQLKESDIIKFLNDKLMPKTIVVFGSYSRGEDIEDSDIDIFIECKEENLDLSKYEKILKRRIQLHFKRDFSEYPKELKNNIMNGIILRGFLEGVK